MEAYEAYVGLGMMLLILAGLVAWVANDVNKPLERLGSLLRKADMHKHDWTHNISDRVRVVHANWYVRHPDLRVEVLIGGQWMDATDVEGSHWVEALEWAKRQVIDHKEVERRRREVVAGTFGY